jgi:hypothetical protein
MEAKELPRLGFGPVQMATFAPLLPVIEEFAIQQQARLSRVFDGSDPINPHCCYFLSWPPKRCRGCFIRICSHELFTVGTIFQIGAQGHSLKRYQQWEYSSDEGQERLRQLLHEALRLIQPEKA